MRKVDIDTNYGQVAGTIENHYAGATKRPPEGHPNSRECPQCHGETWRLTQWCVHCGADLFAIDTRERDRRIARRSIKAALCLMALSGAAFTGQFYVPQSAKLWVMGFAALSVFLAAAVLKA